MAPYYNSLWGPQSLLCLYSEHLFDFGGNQGTEGLGDVTNLTQELRQSRELKLLWKNRELKLGGAVS